MSAPLLLADITSRDTTRVWSSSCAIVKLRDPAELDLLAANISEIREQTMGLDLGGMLMRNSEHLDFALKKLEYWKARKGCLCHLYPGYLMYDPHKEATAGNVRIDETTYTDGKWVDAYFCTCTVCATRFRVEEREYHYTWWGWKIVQEKASPQ